LDFISLSITCIILEPIRICNEAHYKQFIKNTLQRKLQHYYELPRFM